MDPKLSALFDTGYTLLSPEADADGCRIKINRPGVIDTETFTGLDIARATFTLRFQTLTKCRNLLCCPMTFPSRLKNLVRDFFTKS
jgi:hypothetical protein